MLIKSPKFPYLPWESIAEAKKSEKLTENAQKWEKLKNDYNLFIFHSTMLIKSPKLLYLPWESIAEAKK